MAYDLNSKMNPIIGILHYNIIILIPTHKTESSLLIDKEECPCITFVRIFDLTN